MTDDLKRVYATAVLEAITQRQPEMKEYYASSDPGWCIVGTATVCSVLNNLGVKAEPLTVSLDLWGRDYWAKIEREGRMPQGPEVREWTDATNSWAVGIGRGGPEPGRWPGHLVAIVRDEWIYDITAGQGSRPEKGLTVPEVLAGPFPDGFLKPGGLVSYELPDGGKAVYTARPDDRSYKSAPAWRPDRRAHWVGKLTREIGAMIASARRAEQSE